MIYQGGDVRTPFNPSGSAHDTRLLLLAKENICDALIIELVNSVSYKLACANSEDSNHKVCAPTQSDQSLSLLPDEMMDPWLPIERPSKPLMRLHRYAG